jgi:hypothetical protein
MGITEKTMIDTYGLERCAKHEPEIMLEASQLEFELMSDIYRRFSAKAGSSISPTTSVTAHTHTPDEVAKIKQILHHLTRHSDWVAYQKGTTFLLTLSDDSIANKVITILNQLDVATVVLKRNSASKAPVVMLTNVNLGRLLELDTALDLIKEEYVPSSTGNTK